MPVDNAHANKRKGGAGMTAAPTHITIVPDEWHMQHVGKLANGRLFYCETQVAYEDGQSHDYYVAYTFDNDGTLASHEIVPVGVRGQYKDEDANRVGEEILERLGERTTETIKVRPFQIEFDGRTFGFVTSAWDEDGEDLPIEEADEEDIRVEAMPGNTISWYAPWEEGEYDT